MHLPPFSELLMIFLIILVLFGANKIPKIAQDIGAGIREFKKAMNDPDDHDDAPKKTKRTRKKS